MNHKEYLLSEGLKLNNQGLNVIVTDDNKKALFPWVTFQEDMITPAELERQLAHPKAAGLAIICGSVSGNLEVIDFDLKNDLTGDLMKRYIALVPEYLVNKIRIVKTRSGGFHWYYKCEVIEGNKELAKRLSTPSELKDTPTKKMAVLIETRGQGGYVAAPPSEDYTIIKDNPSPVISLEERDLLLEAARSFTEIHNIERARFTSTGTLFVVSPFDDYNNKVDAVALLVRAGWSIVSENSEKVQLLRPGNTKTKTSGNFHKERNLFYVWTSSTEFESGKAYSPVAIYAVLSHGGDYSAAAKQLIKEGYGTKRTPGALRQATEEKSTFDFKFWEVTHTKKAGVKIEINLSQLVTFIHRRGGFTNYKYNAESENIIVQVRDGLVRKAEIQEVKQFLKKEILSLPDTFDGITPDELLEVVYQKYLFYLSKSFMEFLNVTDLDFLKDTKDAAFFPFRNGIVEVTKDGGRLHKYGDYDKVIWASQMIPREITLCENLSESLDFTNIDYCQFIRKVAGLEQKHFEYFISVIGYLLHKYKDPKSAFAVILAEQAESDNKGGGTGKGLFMKAIKELIPTEIFDGKSFNPSDNFAWQRVSLDTKIAAIEDARRGFPFESLYSFITEGLPVNKKNAKEFYIPFADSPKITISTNYTISDEGNHAKRRQKVLEFSNFFSPSHTPFDEFGRMLFEDWDNDEYNRFYNFMFFCTQVYLQGGILSANQSEGNKLKNVKDKYTEDLLLFFTGFAEANNDFTSVKDLYHDFLEAYGFTAKDYERVKFGKGMRYVADVMGYDCQEGVKKISGKSHRVIKVTKRSK